MSETQLWRVKFDGTNPQQLTHNAADVGRFAWSTDGRRIHFRTGEPRSFQAANPERNGYQFDEDLGAFTDLLKVRERPKPGDSRAWVVDVETGKESPDNGTLPVNVVSEAAPDEDAVVAAQGPFDRLEHCVAIVASRWLCVRSTQTRPDHVVEGDVRTKFIRLVADPNQAMAQLQLGKVERIDWVVPNHPAYGPGQKLEGLNKPTARGYILYPLKFDRTKRYPMIVSPYYADGFDHFTRSEMPLHALAAAGFVVLNLSFPDYNMTVVDRLGADLVKAMYNPEFNFPHMTRFGDSTLKAIDMVIARGFVDPDRIGIGGLSQGTIIPLWIAQHHDRFSAMSISSPSWGPWQHYWQTGEPRKKPFYTPWLPRPNHDSEGFYKALDIAENVDQIEMPIVMNLGDEEVWSMLRLIRHMADAGKPYDAYVYRGEGHIKVEPAHLESAMNRNLDWFRFWLQDIEDPEPSKAKQYQRWRELRKLQCKNPRSLRNYCHVTSKLLPVGQSPALH